jgi:tetratricopeptide (TPR) repeat protein
VADFLTDDLLASVYPEKAKSPEVTVRYLLETATENLENKFERSPLVEAKIREALGVTYGKLGDYKTAITHFNRVWKLRREHLGEEAPATLDALSYLSKLYQSTGRYEDAEPLLLKAVEARSRILGKEDPDTLQSICHLAWQYMFQGRFGDAEVPARQVLEIGSRVLGEEHPVVLSAMQCCAYMYITADQTEQAELLGHKGYEISRRLLGEEHEDTLFFMAVLAWMYERQEHLDKAKDLSVKVMEIGRRVFGEEHPSTLAAMSQLGRLYTLEGHLEKAKPLLITSVELSRRVLGEGHLFTLWFTIRLALLYEALGQYDEEVERTLVEAVESIQRLPREHILSGYLQSRLDKPAKAFSRLAREHYEAGKYAESVTVLGRNEKLRRSLNPEDTGLTLPDAAVLAMSLHRLGRTDEAQDALHQLREMFEQDDDTQEEQYLYEAEQVFVSEQSQEHKAWDFIEEGKLSEASEILKHLQTAAYQNTSVSTASVQSIRKALSRAYCIRARSAESQRTYEEAISDYEDALERDPGCTNAHDRLAYLLATSESDKLRDTVRAVEHAIKACELTEWKNSSFTNTLAAAYAESGDFRRAVQYQKQAIELLREEDPEKPLRDYEERLRLYELGHPYRPSIVARWTFEQSNGKVVMDTSGNDLHGQLIGDAEIVYDPDRNGRVIHLDGNNDWMDCGTDPRFNIVSEITITCWAKVSKFNRRRHTIISKGDSAWRLAKDSDSNGLEFACSGLQVQWVTGRKNVNDGRWHCFVGVFDGARISLYVDGELDATSEALGNIKVNSFKVLIGENEQTRGRWGHNRSFNGLLDDIRIYNYALSEAEIKALYAGKESGTTEK